MSERGLTPPPEDSPEPGEKPTVPLPDDFPEDIRVTRPPGLDIDAQRQAFHDSRKREEESKRPEERKEDFREGPQKGSGGGLPDSTQVA